MWSRPIFFLHKYSVNTLCYTDGSKSPQRTKCAFFVDSNTTDFKFQNSFSISSAELAAIFFCLKSIFNSPLYKKIITFFMDLLSSLQILQNPYLSNLLTQRILVMINSLRKRRPSSIVLIWILSHVGINGKKVVDSTKKKRPHLTKNYDRSSTTIKRSQKILSQTLTISLIRKFGRILSTTN
jgi:hypothetical protein